MDIHIWECVQENTPLSGSSAGAIVCAVVASGVTMRAALEATKKLSKDCREKGTAFRLGVHRGRGERGMLLSIVLKWEFVIKR